MSFCARVERDTSCISRRRPSHFVKENFVERLASLKAGASKSRNCSALMDDGGLDRSTILSFRNTFGLEPQNFDYSLEKMPLKTFPVNVNGHKNHHAKKASSPHKIHSPNKNVQGTDPIPLSNVRMGSLFACGIL